MAKKFLKTFKEAKKDAPKAITKSFVRGGTIVAAAYGVNKLLPKVPGVDKIDPKFMKAVGPFLFLAGMAGEAFLEKDAHVALAVAEGIGSYGALKSGGDFMPESMGNKADLGLSGTTDAIAAADTNWNQILEEADKDAGVKGIEEGGEKNLGKVKEKVTLMS
jgi:hypothetical protein